MVVEDVDVVEVDVVLVVVGVVTENVFESTSSWLPEPQVEPWLCGEILAVIVIWDGGSAAVV